ncbi:MAG: LysM peptidoglycan-binding domain-containing protein, partial [Pseudomonadota bacterium]
LSAKTQYYFYVDGQRVGETGTDTSSAASTIDYSQALSGGAGGPDKYARGTVRPITSNFDTGYQPINAGYPAFTSNGYSVRTGDTLQSIALSVWGDSSLWYLIAEANGMLSADAALTDGQSLVIPNKVTNLHYSSSTQKVYNPAEAMGNLSPTLPEPPPPPPPPKKGGCGGVGRILMVIVAV